MGALLGIAARNLVQARRRTLLLGVAIAGVTALLVLLLSLSGGLNETIIRTATTLDTGHVNVGGFYKVRTGTASPMVTGTAAVRQIVEEALPDLVRIVERQRGWASLVGPTGATMAGALMGIEYENEPALGAMLRLAEEREYREGGAAEAKGDLARLREPGTIALFVDQAKKLEVTVGDSVTLSAPNFRGTSNTADVTVVAVLRNVGVMSSWYLFMPAATVRGLYSLKEDNAGALLLYLSEIERADEAMAALRAAFLEKGYRVMEHQGDPYYMKFETVAGEDWTGQKLDLTTWADEVSFLRWILQAFDSISVFLAAILMGIIGVGIVNAMWMAVRERTREIGTLRAIGMSRGRVLALFLLEGMLLGLAATMVGGLAGAGIGIGLDALAIQLPGDAARMILMSDTLHLRVGAGQVLGAVAILTGLTTLATLGPAYRASRLRPITAIHHIG